MSSSDKARHLVMAVAFALLLVVGGWPVAAQEQEPGPEIDWQHGPTTGRLGTLAEIAVPEGCVFTGREGARRFLELTENIPGGDELGILLKPNEEGVDWWVIFSFEPIGYIKDDEKDSLDGDAILKSIREGNEQANKQRRKQGWATIDVVGWEQAPFYDPETNDLSWAIRGRGSEGDVINFNTRLLGRRGVMSANLVIDPELLAASLPSFKSALGGFDFTEGNRYAEFRPGDKIASYGLTALVAGGAAAVAAKTGLLSKFWKLILAGLVALGGLLKKIFGSKRAGTDPITQVPGSGS